MKRTVNEPELPVITGLFMQMTIIRMSYDLIGRLLWLIIIEGLPMAECQMIRNIGKFEPVTSWLNGLPLCAADVPTIAVPVDSLVGIPLPVPNDVRCGFACTGFSNCTSFNYVVSPVALCELYTFTPRNCTSSLTSGSNCRHFEVGLSVGIRRCVSE